MWMARSCHLNWITNARLGVAKADKVYHDCVASIAAHQASGGDETDAAFISNKRRLSNMEQKRSTSCIDIMEGGVSQRNLQDAFSSFRPSLTHSIVFRNNWTFQSFNCKPWDVPTLIAFTRFPSKKLSYQILSSAAFISATSLNPAMCCNYIAALYRSCVVIILRHYIGHVL